MVELEFEEKYEELINTTITKLKEKGLHLFRSGAVNTSEAANDYYLPKLILTAALKEMVWQWSPHTNEAREELANLEKF